MKQPVGRHQITQSGAGYKSCPELFSKYLERRGESGLGFLQVPGPDESSERGLLEPFLKDPCTQLGTSMCVPSAECLTL